MTVKDLKDLLENLPDHAPIVMVSLEDDSDENTRVMEPMNWSLEEATATKTREKIPCVVCSFD